jgi:hypothetical protein
VVVAVAVVVLVVVVVLEVVLVVVVVVVVIVEVVLVVVVVVVVVVAKVVAVPAMRRQAYHPPRSLGFPRLQKRTVATDSEGRLRSASNSLPQSAV